MSLGLKPEHKAVVTKRQVFWLKPDLIPQENGLCTDDVFFSIQPKLRFVQEHVVYVQWVCAWRCTYTSAAPLLLSSLPYPYIGITVPLQFQLLVAMNRQKMKFFSDLINLKG